MEISDVSYVTIPTGQIIMNHNNIFQFYTSSSISKLIRLDVYAISKTDCIFYKADIS